MFCQRTGRRALALSGCLWLAGCLAISPGLPTYGAKPDPLQEALRKADVLETKIAYWKLDPAAVLGEVPLGSTLVQAQTVMQGHGFTCKQDKLDAARVSLICKASQRTGLRDSNVLLVTLSCRWEKVIGVKVITFYN